MARVVRVRLAADQFIAGKLLTEKLVDRLVLIERLKNIVAVMPGIGATGVVAAAAVALRIAGHVQPMSPPAYTKLRRTEQALHQPWPSLRRFVANERLHLGGGRRESDEVVGDPANQRLTPGPWREPESALGQALSDKGIDGCPDVEPAWPRHARFLHGLKSPVAQFLLGKADGVGILRLEANGLCALRDPVPDDLFLIGCQFFWPVRHFVRGNLLPQQAGLGVAGHNGLSGVAAGLHQVHQPDVKSTAFLFFFAVTMKTGGLEDRANICLKLERLGVGGGSARRCEQGSYQAGQVCASDTHPIGQPRWYKNGQANQPRSTGQALGFDCAA